MNRKNNFNYPLIYGLFFLMFFFPVFLLAQEENSPNDNFEEEFYQIDRFVVSVGFSRWLPKGNLANNLPNRWGGNFSFYTRLPSQFPLFVGIDVGFSSFQRYNENYFLIDDEGFEFEVEERTKSNIATIHTILRAQPYFDFFLHPYGEFYLGTKHFYTRTVLKDLDAPEDDDTISNDGQLGTWALSAGGALGVNIPLSSFDTGGVELDLKCIYLKGGNANYSVLLDEIDFSNYTNTFDAFETKNSSTDLLIAQLGLIVYFGG